MTFGKVFLVGVRAAQAILRRVGRVRRVGQVRRGGGLAGWRGWDEWDG